MSASIGDTGGGCCAAKCASTLALHSGSFRNSATCNSSTTLFTAEAVAAAEAAVTSSATVPPAAAAGATGGGTSNAGTGGASSTAATEASSEVDAVGDSETVTAFSRRLAARLLAGFGCSPVAASGPSRSAATAVCFLRISSRSCSNKAFAGFVRTLSAWSACSSSPRAAATSSAVARSIALRRFRILFWTGFKTACQPSDAASGGGNAAGDAVRA
jgi:hypothetical protein